VAKILIVEDDTLLSKMYYSIFTSENYQVDTAINGEEGLEKARAGKPALILLDIMMPKLNGMEVLKKLKADPDVKNIPVVVLTNLAGDADIQTALNMGAVRYIIKSEHKPKEVEAIVREVLSGYTRNDVPPAS
jgi:chemosensory pili system protein ChpA (sensor histidine kinase/response regulator)